MVVAGRGAGDAVTSELPQIRIVGLPDVAPRDFTEDQIK